MNRLDFNKMNIFEWIFLILKERILWMKILDLVLNQLNWVSITNIQTLDCVAFATRAFATPIFVASATPYFRTFATRTAATPKKMFNFSFV